MNDVTTRPGELTQLRRRLDALERAAQPTGEAGWVPASWVPPRFNISPRTFERWLRNRKMGFPKPFRINGRRYFHENDLRTFQAQQEARKEVDL